MTNKIFEILTASERKNCSLHLCGKNKSFYSEELYSELLEKCVDEFLGVIDKKLDEACIGGKMYCEVDTEEFKKIVDGVFSAYEYFFSSVAVGQDFTELKATFRMKAISFVTNIFRSFGYDAYCLINNGKFVLLLNWNVEMTE